MKNLDSVFIYNYIHILHTIICVLTMSSNHVHIKEQPSTPSNDVGKQLFMFRIFQQKLINDTNLQNGSPSVAKTF